MVQLTIEQRVFIVLHYTKTQSIAAVQNAFLERFPDRNPPCKTTILRNFQKYSNAGTSLNLNKGNSGRRRTTRTEENIAAIRALLEENQRVSARRNPIDIYSSSFNRITKFELRWHPYKMHVRHQLLPTDLPRRLHFVEWFVERCRRRPNFLESLIVGDEAAFAMNGEVCTHNVRQYAQKGHPPEFNFERNASREKLHIWAAICGNGVILGPYFFDRNVTGIVYLQMLNEFVFPQLVVHFGSQYWEGHFRNLWWVQDGASPHRVINVRDRLYEVFGNNRVVGLGHDVEWPPRSSDLTPCDFFLWGYIKSKVFVNPPQTIHDLRQKIINEFNALQQQQYMIRNAVRGMQKRALLCVERNGGHVEGQGA